MHSEKVGVCALCKKNEPLRNSHIIPEFFYEYLYDEKHRGLIISAEPKEKIKFFQKGMREKLLCEYCEQRLSIYERYISQLFFHADTFKTQNEHYIIVSNVDYKKLKLFQLSVLWRASVSKLPFFSSVHLGPHEEVIRSMLLDENPGIELAYGCFLTAIHIDESKPVIDLIMAPALVRDNGFRIFRFLFGGFIWVYVVSSHNEQFSMRDYFLKSDGTLVIVKRPIEKIKFIIDFGRNLKSKES